MHPDDPHTMRFPRTAREAFGSNFYEEKPSHDVLWGIGYAVLLASLAVVVVYLRTK